MTQESKNKMNKWLEFIPKAITPALIVYAIWAGSAFMARSEDRQFSTIEDKVNTESHIKGSLKEIDKRVLDQHLIDTDVHTPRLIKDSLYVRRPEFDTLVQRNATTVFQFKEEFKTYREIQEKILEKLEGN
jgi:hypothetical protein